LITNWTAIETAALEATSRPQHARPWLSLLPKRRRSARWLPRPTANDLCSTPSAMTLGYRNEPIVSPRGDNPSSRAWYLNASIARCDECLVERELRCDVLDLPRNSSNCCGSS
jgi:hypothetical protein